ncbi:MAG: LacI family DNA-binding transcriptional regulator [Victivallaceae bacterium]
MIKKQKVKLKDIAERAGVSLTSASMFLNGKAKRYNISDAACERVRQAIEDLNYVPNIHARAIASKKTLLLGTVISGGIDASFWQNILSGIEETIIKDNYHMLLSVSHSDPKAERETIDFMRNKGIDGLIISPVSATNENHDFLRELNQEYPIITLNHHISGLSGVYNDNYCGGELAAEYIISSGHRKIAYIGGMNQSRAQAFFKFSASQGITPTAFPDPKTFFPHIAEFTAVFCFCDYFALEIYREAAARNLKIPEQLSVVGYDNMEFARLITPSLSTIEQYKKELGVAAAEMVLNAIKSESKSETIEKVFTPRLITGQSVRKI